MENVFSFSVGLSPVYLCHDSAACTWGAVAQSIERASPAEEAVGSIPAGADLVRSLSL